MKTIVNSLKYNFVKAEGLLSKREYSFRVRAKNYYTNYFTKVGTWSAASIFFSSDLPKPIP